MHPGQNYQGESGSGRGPNGGTTGVGALLQDLDGVTGQVPVDRRRDGEEDPDMGMDLDPDQEADTDMALEVAEPVVVGMVTVAEMVGPVEVVVVVTTVQLPH
ncbi:hypothetical protein Bca52824_070725 [Brassica carinata]|uniref:Uncharacterized protein n=1 Tax=Brassica carinata TaxID=52824 RepID=A0A8X7U5C6_BRACI|nr:hypothetical protein Bca52824_070725 [Brassica carinata]